MASRLLPTQIAIQADLACGLIALLVALLAVWESIAGHSGRASVLVHMAATDPLAEIAASDPNFEFVQVHYDGIYGYAIALDPVALGPVHGLIDAPANRYGHPAYGWFASALSFGQLLLLPLALLLVSLGGLVVAAIAASRLSQVLGWTPWGGLVVALNPGLIFAVTADTSEALGAAFLTTSLLAWIRAPGLTAAALLVGLCFCKEALLLVPVGLAAWEGILVLRGGLMATFRRRLLLLAAGPILYLAWYAYLGWRFGTWPFESIVGGLPQVSWPLTGWIDALGRAGDLATSSLDSTQIGWAAVPLLAVSLVAILLGMARALRLRSPLDPVYLLTAVLALSLGWAVVLYPKDLIRGLSFVFLLLPAVAVAPRLVQAAPEQEAPATAAAVRGPSMRRSVERGLAIVAAGVLVASGAAMVARSAGMFTAVAPLATLPPAGEVWFASSLEADNLTPVDRFISMPKGHPLTIVGHFTRQPAAGFRVQISLGDAVVGQAQLGAGSGDEYVAFAMALEGFGEAGTYTIALVDDGGALATGELVVTP